MSEEKKIIKIYDNTRVVYPFKNEDGTTCWNNVFRIDAFTILIVLSILFISYAYSHDTEQCRDIIADPCKYMPDMNCQAKDIYTPTFEMGIKDDVVKNTEN